MPKVEILSQGAIDQKIGATKTASEFVAREFESILQAGLNAGVALEYGCSNGNCGECLARLVSGDIEKIRHFDFVISERDKVSGHFLMCCYQAESDIIIEAPEASGVADIPLQSLQVRVKNIEQVDDQIIKIHLRTPRSNRLRFMAGQSVKLGGDRIPEGIYPIASCPCDEMNLYFHIPNIPGDSFAEWVFAGNLRKNTSLPLKGPKGHFILGKEIKRPVLLVSWHTGFASMQALIEHTIALETEQNVHLYRLSPTPDHHYLNNLCRSWTDAFDNFHYHPVPDRYSLMSEPEDGERILRQIAGKHQNFSEMDVFIAGPPSLTAAADKLFNDLGLPEQRLKCETIALGFYDD